MIFKNDFQKGGKGLENSYLELWLSKICCCVSLEQIYMLKIFGVIFEIFLYRALFNS